MRAVPLVPENIDGCFVCIHKSVATLPLANCAATPPRLSHALKPHVPTCG